MPLARYFFYVGGVLLVLLLIVDACLPKLPVLETTNINLPITRTYSERKWPERVVLDSRLPIVTPTQLARAGAIISVTETISDVSATTRVREAFALLRPIDQAAAQSLEAKTQSRSTNAR